MWRAEMVVVVDSQDNSAAQIKVLTLLDLITQLFFIRFLFFDMYHIELEECKQLISSAGGHFNLCMIHVKKTKIDQEKAKLWGVEERPYDNASHCIGQMKLLHGLQKFSL